MVQGKKKDFPYPTLAHCRNANNKRAAFDDSIDLAIDMLLDVVKAHTGQTLLDAAACTTGVESTETPFPMEPFTLLPQQTVAPVHDLERRPRSRSTAKQRTPQLLGCLRLQLCLDKHQGQVSRNQCKLM